MSMVQVMDPGFESPHLNHVLAALEGLRGGEHLVVGVAGPAGSGKTTLANQVIRAVVGWSVTRVRALSWQAAEPGALLAQADHRVEGSYVELLGAPGARHLLVVDDAHWADESSLRQLIERATTLPSSSFALLATAADAAELPAALADSFDYLIRLPPLGVEGVQAFALREVGARLTPTTAAALREMTGGRPGPLREVLTAVPRDHWLGPDPTLPLPEVWVSALRRRLGSLEVDRLLAAVVVLPHPGPAPLLASMVEDAQLEANLDAAIAAGVLRTNSANEFSFVRPTDAAVVDSRVGPHLRAALHHRAAAYYRERCEEDTAIIHEALAQTTPDVRLSGALAEQAQALSLGGQWRRAADVLRLAARLAPTPEDAARLRLEAIESTLASSDVLGARLATAALPRGQADARVDCTRAYLALYEGRAQETDFLLNRAWEELERTGSTDAELRTRVAARRTMAALSNWRPREIMAWSATTDRWAPPESPERIEAKYIALVGHAALTGQRPKDEPLPGETPLLAQRREMAFGWIDLAFDDPLSAHQRLSFSPGVGGSERIGLYMHAWLARTQFVLGLWPDAMASVEQGLARAERYGIRFLEPLLLWTGAQIARYRGEVALARNYAHRLTLSHDALLIQRLPSALCRLLLGSLDGDHTSTNRAGEELGALASELGGLQPGFWPWEDVWAQHLVGIGELDRAEEALATAEQAAAASGLASLQAKIAVPRGTLLVARGDLEAGLQLLDAAAEQISATPMPAYQGRVFYEYGRVLRRVGRRRLADEMFRRASEVFATMGAQEFVSRANRERRAGGLGTRTTGPGGLTPQEREIARLVAGGASNREVAQELFLSAKTVEYHLTRVYRKLRIRSRNALAAALSDL